MPIRHILADKIGRWLAVVAIVALVLIVFGVAWYFGVNAGCDSAAVRTCETADDCMMERGFCCDITNVYNVDAFERCNESPGAHCEMVCASVYRTTCKEGRCGYELDEAATRARRDEF